MSPAEPKVEVGQIWADNDPRAEGRTLRIAAIVDDHAECIIVTNPDYVQADLDRCEAKGKKAAWTTDRRGRLTTIKISRFRPTSTGYRLLDAGES